MKHPIWRRFAAAVLLAVAVALVPGSSAADIRLNFCKEYLAPEPEIAGTGVSGIVTQPLRLSDPDSWDSGGRYQQYGTAGIQWHTIITKDCVDPKRALLLHDRANTIMDFTRVGTDIVILVYQLAASDMATEWVGRIIDPIVSGFQEGFFRPLLSVAVFIGAVWMAWVGLIRKRATLTMEGAVWMCFAIAFGLFVMAAPSNAVALANRVTNGATVLIHDSLQNTPLIAGSNCTPDGVTVGFQDSRSPEHFSGGGTPRPAPPSDEGTGNGTGGTGNNDSDDSDEETDSPRDPAENDGGGPADGGEDEEIPSFESPDEDATDGPPHADLSMTPMSADTDMGMPFDTDAATWKHSEMIFSSLLCEPWIVGAFGVSGAPGTGTTGMGSESREAARSFTAQALRSQAITQAERESWGTGVNFNPDAHEATMEAKADEYRAVSEQVYHYYPESWPMWSGENQGSRTAIAVTAFLGMLIGGSLIGAISVAILIVKMGIYLLLMMSPFVFLIGIHPGTGRVILLKWVEVFGGFMLKQVFLVGTLVVFLILYSWTFALPFPWFLKIVIIGIFVAVAVMARKIIAQTFAAMTPGALGGAFQKVADDKSLKWGAMTNPAVMIRQRERAAAEKVKKILPMALGAMTGGAAAGALAGVLGGKKNPAAAPPLSGQGPTVPPRRSPTAAPPRPGGPGGPPPAGGGPRPGPGPGGPTPGPGPRPHGGGTAPAPAPLAGPPPGPGGGGGGTAPPRPGGPTPPPRPGPGGGGGGGGGTVPPRSGGGGGTTPPPRPGPASGPRTTSSPLSGRRVVIHRDGAPPLEVPRHEVIDEVVEDRRTPPTPPPPRRTTRRRRIIRWDRPLSDRWGRGERPAPRDGDPPPRD